VKRIKNHHPDLFRSCSLRQISESPATVAKTYQGNKAMSANGAISSNEYPKATPPNATTRPTSPPIIDAPSVPHQYSDLETLESKSFHLMK